MKAKPIPPKKRKNQSPFHAEGPESTDIIQPKMPAAMPNKIPIVPIKMNIIPNAFNRFPAVLLNRHLPLKQYHYRVKLKMYKVLLL